VDTVTLQARPGDSRAELLPRHGRGRHPDLAATGEVATKTNSLRWILNSALCAEMENQLSQVPSEGNPMFRRPAPELDDSDLATPNSSGNYWPNNADDLVRAGIDPEMHCLALVLVQTYTPDPDRI
jgi:hypothetical protein